MTDNRGEAPDRGEASVSLAVWLRRLWPLTCLAAAIATFGYSLYDGYQIDGDAVAYMDIGDLIRSHQWSGVVNSYWNPLYPAALSLGHAIFRATRFTELRAYYFTNFGIFLLEMMAVVVFCDAIIRLRGNGEATGREFLLEKYALRYLGLGLLVISTQRELSMGKVRPDGLLTALMLFGLAFLMNYVATGMLRYPALMGLVLGLAYLTKSFAFLFTLICILALVVFAWISRSHSRQRVLLAAGLSLTGFAVVAGPYITALSKQKGHFDFGDSGSLNYAWYVGGTQKMHLQPYQTDEFGSAEVHLKHPEKELLRVPPVFAYNEMRYGTYPDWFDATYWNDSVKPHMTLRGEIPRAGRNVVLVFRYLLNHPEGMVVFALFMLLGSRLRLAWRSWISPDHSFWMIPALLGLAVWAIYGIVNIEERYVTVAYLAILLPAFAALRIRAAEDHQSTAGSRSVIIGAVSAVALLFAFLAIGESTRVVLEQRRHLSGLRYPGGWYDPETFNAAKALNAIGVGPGDAIACIGFRACIYDHYWARLAGVRILTEIYVPNEDVYRFLAGLKNRSQTLDVVRRQGGKVLVGYFSQPGELAGSEPASAGWQALGNTPFFQLPLNLPAEKDEPQAGTAR